MDYLQSDLITEHIQEQYGRIKGALKQYRRGSLTRDDCRRIINNAIWDGYFRFIQKELKFNFNYRVWDDFLNEFNKFEQNVPLTEATGESWLNSQQWDDINKAWVPASASDRAQTLRLMQAFHIPPEYHTPIPDNIPLPHTRVHPSGGDLCVSTTISFKCEADGGLLECDAPCGKTFTLKNNLGLEAVITIKEVFSEPKEILHNRAFADYRGEGYIEGYTEMNFQRRNPELYIRLEDGKVDRMIAFLSNEDWHVYNRFPMWQDYFHWMQFYQTMFEKAIDSFFESFKNAGDDILTAQT